MAGHLLRVTSARRWRVKRGSMPASFPADGLVLQRDGRGLLDLSVFVVPATWTNLSLLQPVATAAVSEAIRKDTGIISWLHWPDLVTIDGRAVARVRVSRTSKAVEVGVRVDCSAANGVALHQRMRPISILQALGARVDVDLLRDRVLEALDWYTAEWERGVYSKLVARIEPSVRWIGSEVEAIKASGAHLSGKALALDESGSLVLEAGDASRLSLPPGDVLVVLPVRQSPQRRAPKHTLL